MLAAEIAQYLDDRGIGTFAPSGTSGNIFISFLPDSPDECISIYHRGGLRGDSTGRHYFPSIQLIVRGTKRGNSGWDTAMQALDALQYFHHGRLISNGEYIIRTDCVQSAPAYIERDEKGRVEYSINIDFMVSRDSPNIDSC